MVPDEDIARILRTKAPEAAADALLQTALDNGGRDNVTFVILKDEEGGAMNEKILADRYKLIEQIGHGGMAIVYRAVDMRTGHNVAVKVLRPEFNKDAEFVGRFQREAEAASKMTHHNIVNLLDVGMDGENRYLVMEYVQGKTLKDLIHEKGRLNPQAAAQITIRILSALQHAHQNGIIHRDIKPQNILVNAEGHVKVADFGIARMANSSTLTKGDSVMGSVHYFSPEQASGQAAGRSQRYLQLRRGALRNAHRTRALRWGQPRGRGHAAPAR